MRKNYSKPTITLMKLRPEEKMALCDWPTTHMASTPGCSTYTWITLPGAEAICDLFYNNSGNSGS